MVLKTWLLQGASELGREEVIDSRVLPGSRQTAANDDINWTLELGAWSLELGAWSLKLET
jgi:hypothetical protein